MIFLIIVFWFLVGFGSGWLIGFHRVITLYDKQLCWKQPRCLLYEGHKGDCVMGYKE